MMFQKNSFQDSHFTLLIILIADFIYFGGHIIIALKNVEFFENKVISGIAIIISVFEIIYGVINIFYTFKCGKTNSVLRSFYYFRFWSIAFLIKLTIFILITVIVRIYASFEVINLNNKIFYICSSMITGSLLLSS